MGILQDSANHTDERYTRIKSENAALQARIIMLEEQLRDTELRHEERLQVGLIIDLKMLLKIINLYSSDKYNFQINIILFR